MRHRYMFRAVKATTSALLLWSSVLSARSAADEPELPKLVLTVERSVLFVGDPLAIKIQLTNTTRAGVPIPSAFCFHTGAIGIEACPPRSRDEYQHIRTPGEGLLSGFRPTGWEWKLAPGATLVAYEHLFWAEKERTPTTKRPAGPWFSVPGRWRIRARTGANGVRVVSEPVTIDVTERSPEGTAALNDCVGGLALATHEHGRLSAAKLEQLKESLPALGKSNAAALVVRVLLLAQLYGAGDRKSKTRQQAWDALQKYRDGLPDPARELLDLQTCEILLDRGEDAEAETLLKTITLNSVRRYKIMATLEDRKRQLEAKPLGK